MSNSKLAKSARPPKEKSLELGFELQHSGDILQTGRQRIPDRWSDKTELALTRRFKITCWNFQKASHCCGDSYDGRGGDHHIVNILRRGIC